MRYVMQCSARSLALPLWAALLLLAPPASAVTIDWVTVGDPGNACDTQSQGCFGSVGSVYQISKYEITNAQYAEFLNAKAGALDPLGLYSTNMDPSAGFNGGIALSSGVYVAVAGRENMPVNHVSFYDALRFANWLQNGQGSGDTETGAYTLLGETATPSNGTTVTRNGGVGIFLASEDEWYKAAYYNALTTSYFDYPAGSNTATTCTAPMATANSANCDDPSLLDLLDADVDDLTAVGAFTGSDSPYDTFDQGGNVAEWTEAIAGTNRVWRGGSWNGIPGNLAASSRSAASPITESSAIGFRVVTVVPEPTTGLLLAIGLLALSSRRRRVSRSSLSTVLVLGAASALASAGQAQILEVNVTDWPDRFNGQTAINVNPLNPNSLVFTATHHVGCTPSDPLSGEPGLCATHHCFIAYSLDRGETWTEVPWPEPECGEPSSFVDSEGTFYLVWNRLNAASGGNQLAEPVLVSRSVDGGATWSSPVATSVTIGKNPKSRVDLVTGKLYVLGGHAFGANRISVSADRGNSWSSPNNELPGDHIAVHDGILVTGTAQPAVVMQVSRDDGQTFAPRPVTNSAGVPVTGTFDPYAENDPVRRTLTPQPPWLSADRTRSGRFAAMVPRGDTFEVYVTENAGLSWTGPAVIDAVAWAFPWMDFGPTGLLGVMWRTGAPSTNFIIEGPPSDPVDVYATVSFDHGRTFAAPVKVNSVTGTNTITGPPGDDWSWILVDDEDAFVGWCDDRNGDAEGFFARVPLALFEGSSGLTGAAEPVTELPTPVPALPRPRLGL